MKSFFKSTRSGMLIANCPGEMKNEFSSSHASLFSTGYWATHGCFYDENRKPTKAEGQTQIFRNSNHWFAKNLLHLSDRNTIVSVYQIHTSGAYTAEWTSCHSLIKGCRGSLKIHEDLIMLTFSSEDGQFSGFEILRKRCDSQYTNRGQLFFNNQRHSSWSLELWKDERDDACQKQSDDPKYT